MEVNLAVVEDDDNAVVSLRQCLDKYSKAKNVKFNITRFSSAEQFLDRYESRYDIVIMDIILRSINGVEAAKLLRRIDPKVILIFVTNTSQYAIKGYEVDALDYILKPLNYHSFFIKMNKVLKLIQKPKTKSLSIRTRIGTQIIEISDIYYIDIIKHNMTIHLLNEKVSSYGILSEKEKELISYGFARCSACALVNLRYVEGLYRDNIKMKNGDMVHIGRSKKNSFLEQLNKFLSGSINL